MELKTKFNISLTGLIVGIGMVVVGMIMFVLTLNPLTQLAAQPLAIFAPEILASSQFVIWPAYMLIVGVVLAIVFSPLYVYFRRQHSILKVTLAGVPSPTVQNPSISTLAVVGFVLGVSSMIIYASLIPGLAAIIASLFGLQKISKKNYSGKSLAWVGLVTGVMGVLHGLTSTLK